MKKTKLVLAIILIICTTALCFTACSVIAVIAIIAVAAIIALIQVRRVPSRNVQSKLLFLLRRAEAQIFRTRAIADVLSKNLNTSVIVENQPGGGRCGRC